MAAGLLSLLANRSNQAILGLLAVEPAYPRKVGQLLSLSETEVSRRLKRMEDLGLLQSSWENVGKNVKMYRLAVNGARIRISGEGLTLDLEDGSGEAPPVAAPGSSPVASARVLIPELDGFVGRADELARLGNGASVALVEGLPGMGKTSLLARYAAEQEPGRVFWHGFRGVESLRWLANRLAVFQAQAGDRTLLEALAPDTEPADLHQMILDALDRPEFHHILDDVHRVDDEAVRNLIGDAIGNTRHGHLVISAREPPRHDPSLPHVTAVRLEGLGDDDVAALAKAKGVALEDGLLPRLREEVGGHPLALNLLLEAVKEGGDLDALLDRIPEKGIEEYLLREVYETLSDSERQALAHASLFRTPFTLDMLRAVSGKDPERALLRLRRRLLVETHGDGYVLHEVVRNFFYHLLQDKNRLHEKAARYLMTDDSNAARLESMHHLLAAGRRTRVLDLLEDDLDLREFDFLDDAHHNLYHDILDSFERGEVKDPTRWALIEDEKGDIAYHRGDYRDALAHYRTALEAFDPQQHPERVADLAWKRALALMRLGRRDDARTAIEEGLAVAPEEGVSRGRLEGLESELKVEA